MTAADTDESHSDDGKAGAARFGEGLQGALPESPAAERNKQPILEVLERVLPAKGLVLEIASGTGQHVAHFAAALPALEWQPTDPDPDLLATIRARSALRPLPNLRQPLRLDVTQEPWPVAGADAVFCANMIHIAPWAATPALFRGAAARLPVGSPLLLYGPFRRDDAPTAASNEAFDASLRSRNADWGLRDLPKVVDVAARHGFSLDALVEMPANNLMVVFRRGG